MVNEVPLRSKSLSTFFKPASPKSMIALFTLSDARSWSLRFPYCYPTPPHPLLILIGPRLILSFRRHQHNTNPISSLLRCGFRKLPRDAKIEIRTSCWPWRLVPSGSTQQLHVLGFASRSEDESLASPVVAILSALSSAASPSC